MQVFALSCDYVRDAQSAIDLIKVRFQAEKSTYKLILVDFYLVQDFHAIDLMIMVRDYLRNHASVVKQPYIACISGITYKHDLDR